MMSFDIVSVSEPKVTVLTIKQDAEALKAAVDAEKAFTEKKKAYQDANSDVIDRLIKAEGANQPVRGKDAAIQGEWNKWREQTAEYAKKVSEVRKKVGADQPIIEISRQDQRNPIDTTAYDGEVVSKEITVDGQVKTDAGTSPKKFVFTLQRVTLKNVNGKDVVGRWVITDRKDAQ